ncbi:excisionase family DNA-binding protein [Staphylococcus pettenkoferi]|uniref:excisionase family DNA-binding protein n=1 Tax=Staphylococcus pettenkoferi TaxID=170573 RepID=UPI00066BC27C|nr:excisionase family DNA-binding protein [Staphylococcus pettenkoferi]MCY1585148.1 excisionase family DNA-binding protein [Staphylococcus pettenkoferi]MCY1588930.1 excisionase family DNA-binding protein [Staphylococcus pettenkoferi]MCY1604737.1 excisionase family DNA-binding protein [Staphylococcus pettenkoferi]
MFNINIDEDEAREMMQQAIDKRVDELEREKYFMSYEELCEYVGLSKPTVEHVLIRNGLHYYRAGKRYLFKRNEVDEFLERLTSQMDVYNNDLKQITLK